MDRGRMRKTERSTSRLEQISKTFISFVVRRVTVIKYTFVLRCNMAVLNAPQTPKQRRQVFYFALVASALLVLAKEIIFFSQPGLSASHRSLSASEAEADTEQLAFQPPPQLQTIGRRQLEFVHITKTGGSAIERAAAFAGFNWGACRHYIFRKVGCLEPPDLPYNASDFHAGSNGKPFYGESWHCPHHWMNPDPHQGKATFCVIRNPYDRYVSEYSYMAGTISGQVLDAKAMNEFIQAKIQQYSTRPFWPAHFLPMHYYVYDENGNQVVDHVLRFENLKNEFDKLMDVYKLDIVLSSRRQVVPNGLTKKQLTPETIALVNEYAKRDFELFGYKMVTNVDELP